MLQQRSAARSPGPRRGQAPSSVRALGQWSRPLWWPPALAATRTWSPSAPLRPWALWAGRCMFPPPRRRTGTGPAWRPRKAGVPLVGALGVQGTPSTCRPGGGSRVRAACPASRVACTLSHSCTAVVPDPEPLRVSSAAEAPFRPTGRCCWPNVPGRILCAARRSHRRPSAFLPTRPSLPSPARPPPPWVFSTWRCRV
jgi:hypothetical protein